MTETLPKRSNFALTRHVGLNRFRHVPPVLSFRGGPSPRGPSHQHSQQIAPANLVFAVQRFQALERFAKDWLEFGLFRFFQSYHSQNLKELPESASVEP
jgi:hypothetical protein